MIRRIDQALLVNRLLVECVDLQSVEDEHKRKYMRNYLEIITTVSSILLIKSGTQENLEKKKELWQYIKDTQPALYRNLR